MLRPDFMALAVQIDNSPNPLEPRTGAPPKWWEYRTL